MSCVVCGIENNLVNSRKFKQILCRKHYLLARRTGDPFTITKRTPNQYIIHESYAEIVLRDVESKEVGRTKISLDKVEIAKKYKWHKSNNGYVLSNVKNKALLLHRLIADLPKDQLVDHINGDRLDNRNENLRPCTFLQNRQNQKAYPHSTSGVTGVYYSETNKGWIAQIWYNKEYYYLGTHETMDEAIKARKEAEVKFRKEFRRKEG
jgi:hypothetical protein